MYQREPEQEAAIYPRCAYPTMVEADEIADAVWFLAHNKACTGTSLIVDGGIGLNAVLSDT